MKKSRNKKGEQMRKINPDFTDPEFKKDEEYYYAEDVFEIFLTVLFWSIVVGAVLVFLINWR
jgi:hypothetical protein